jgi:hypothetical protein
MSVKRVNEVFIFIFVSSNVIYVYMFIEIEKFNKRKIKTKGALEEELKFLNYNNQNRKYINIMLKYHQLWI